VIGLWLLTLLALAPAACDTVPDYPNRPLATGAANPPPADLIGADPGAALILIAFSGGGSRAAAPGLGVLNELGAQSYPATGQPVSLIDRVKVVSSVSGGRVVAAWFGLVGPARRDELKTDFLERDNMKTLEWEAKDPLTLARLSLSSYTRIDALRDLLDRELFHGAFRRFAAAGRAAGRDERDGHGVRRGFRLYAAAFRRSVLRSRSTAALGSGRSIRSISGCVVDDEATKLQLRGL
jgi:hypothetical protein